MRSLGNFDLEKFVKWRKYKNMHSVQKAVAIMGEQIYLGEFSESSLDFSLEIVLFHPVLPL